MKIIKPIRSIQKNISQLKRQNKKIGFVPTMGALHEGHVSLIRKARRENDIVVASIFVNPMQFGPNEDFHQYPREEKKDKKFLQSEKIDILFYPTVEEMYKKDQLTFVEVETMTQGLCGEFRPDHFRGVTTVVAKLLNIVRPDVLYLGQKDAQQAAIIKKMAVDLNMPVAVKICPTIREKDGLAMSSRNSYLTVRQRLEAPVLFQALQSARKIILNGQCSVRKIIGMIEKMITLKSSADIQYIQCVNAQTLRPLTKFDNRIMIALAVNFGKTRLIDNIVFDLK
ncbi:Pantoate--beta-alanine ligase [hydrothermal vent metagenome]|uniref:pantoate--beta-alanine ligase (AMP-forming) n=1 Tax=hydrothermal vent metagenome TaxID=652676 RepID=A0A3B1DGB6_9ZZZZ